MVNQPLRQPFRILLLGNGGVGKTSLAYQFGHKTFHQNAQRTNLEEAYNKDVLIDGLPVKTTILDTWSTQYDAPAQCVDKIVQAGQAFILVYSVTRRYTFQDTVSLCRKVRQVMQDASVVCALVGNKCDLWRDREVSADEGRALAFELECEFFETSAKAGDNLELILRTLVRRLAAKFPRKKQKFRTLRSLPKFICFS